MDSKSVEVERNGVKLGWNILAILATVGLGLYVTSIIAPLKIELSHAIANISQTQEDLKENQRIDSNVHEQFKIYRKGQDGVNDYFDREIKALQGKL
jgi:hypothetical protein